MSKSDRKYSFLLIAIALATLGCNDGKGLRIPITGKVTVDGELLTHGSVTFLPSSGQQPARAGGASINDKGEFQVSSFTANDGLLLGKYHVTVLALEPINESSQKWHAPKKYSNMKTSGLEFEVTKETTGANFDLSWEGEDPSEPFVEKF